MQIKYILAAGLLCATAPAHATDYLFTFASDLTDASAANAVAGTVTGRILGLSDSGTSSATQLFIDSFTPNAGAALPTDAASWTIVHNNSFTVQNGAITAANFWADRGAGGSFDQLFINVPLSYTGNTNYASVGVNNVSSVWNNLGMGGVTFTAINSAVPEPATWAMMLIGFGGIGYSIRSSKRRNKIIYSVA